MQENPRDPTGIAAVWMKGLGISPEGVASAPSSFTSQDEKPMAPCRNISFEDRTWPVADDGTGMREDVHDRVVGVAGLILVRGNTTVREVGQRFGIAPRVVGYVLRRLMYSDSSMIDPELIESDSPGLGRIKVYSVADGALAWAAQRPAGFLRLQDYVAQFTVELDQERGI